MLVFMDELISSEPPTRYLQTAFEYPTVLITHINTSYILTYGRTDTYNASYTHLNADRHPPSSYSRGLSTMALHEHHHIGSR